MSDENGRTEPEVPEDGIDPLEGTTEADVADGSEQKLPPVD
jgi:hypothetical protein